MRLWLGPCLFISTFEVPGSKLNLLLPGTSSGQKTLFLPGSSLFLPAGDMGGEINIMVTSPQASQGGGGIAADSVEGQPF